MVSYITEQILEEKIYLNPHNLNFNNLETTIIKNLINKVGNKCSKNGFIIKDSIEFINKTLGKMVNINNFNKIEYNIKYKAKLILPNKGDIIECNIDNINKMGIIGYIKKNKLIQNYKGENTLKESPIIIIVPNNKIINEKLIDNNKITIYVQGIRLKFGSEQIQIVGDDVNYIIQNLMEQNDITENEAKKMINL